ncbi:MAG: hypothetical protein ABIL25_07075 [candidate division WOR-3 bacterium]
MRPAAIALVLVTLLAAQEPPAQHLLGRAPLENIIAISAGRFTSTDADDVLALQDLGRVQFASAPGLGRAEAGLFRLALLRLESGRFSPVWQSQPMLASTVPQARLAANAWTAADINSDSKQEILLFGPDSCTVVSFDQFTARTRSVPMRGAWVTDAAACDLNSDSVPEITTLELSPLDSALTGRLLRVYHVTDSGLVAVSEYIGGIDWGPDIELTLLGSARLEEYWGTLPVLAGIYHSVRPSMYAVLADYSNKRKKPETNDQVTTETASGSEALTSELSGEALRLTSHPFPWRKWFTKDEILPAGRLSLFNVGDTLVAYGYFVPGSGRVASSRPTPNSFAALQDGAWRLLPLTDAASRISGPVCRFSLDGTQGWLELRDDVFRFYPGEIFHWR